MFAPKADPDENSIAQILVQTDSDWAADLVSRHSISGGALYHGRHLLKTWSREQPCTALSSAEAELYAATQGAQQALGMKSYLEDMGIRAGIVLEIDASATLGILNRDGIGRTRHIDVRSLWLQDQVKQGKITVRKVPGVLNTADLGTKALDEGTILRHMTRMGYEEIGTAC